MTDGEAMALAERDEARAARDAWADAADKAHQIIAALEKERDVLLVKLALCQSAMRLLTSQMDPGPANHEQGNEQAGEEHPVSDGHDLGVGGQGVDQEAHDAHEKRDDERDGHAQGIGGEKGEPER